MKTILFAFLLLFCASCGSKKDVYDTITYTNFPETIELKGENIKLSDSVMISFPYMSIADSLCCIYDLRSQEKLFHLFSFPDFQYIRSFGTFGNGNNEFNEQFRIELTKDYLYAYGYMTQKMYVFDIKNGKSELIQATKFDNQIQLVTIMNDSMIVHGSNRDDFGIFISSMAGNRIDSLFPLPKVDEQFKLDAASVWSGIVKYNEKRDVIVSVLNFGEVLTIFNQKDKSSVVAVGQLGKPSPVPFRGFYLPSETTCFIDMCLTDKYIYTLFSGAKVEDAMQKNSNLDIKIYVYDYEGNPVKCIKVAQTLISIYVDEQAQKIYGNAFEEENPIYVYDLK